MIILALVVPYKKIVGLMLVKIIILLLFALIVGSLGSALFSMLKNKGNDNRTARTLTYRIGLSILAFIILMISAKLGWIQPHGLSL